MGESGWNPPVSPTYLVRAATTRYFPAQSPTVLEAYLRSGSQGTGTYFRTDVQAYVHMVQRLPILLEAALEALILHPGWERPGREQVSGGETLILLLKETLQELGSARRKDKGVIDITDIDMLKAVFPAPHEGQKHAAKAAAAALARWRWLPRCAPRYTRAWLGASLRCGI